MRQWWGSRRKGGHRYRVPPSLPPSLPPSPPSLPPSSWEGGAIMRQFPMVGQLQRRRAQVPGPLGQGDWPKRMEGGREGGKISVSLVVLPPSLFFVFLPGILHRLARGSSFCCLSTSTSVVPSSPSLPWLLLRSACSCVVKSGQKVGEVGGEGGREGKTYHTPAVVVALVAGVILHHLLLLVHIRATSVSVVPSSPSLPWLSSRSSPATCSCVVCCAW